MTDHLDEAKEKAHKYWTSDDTPTPTEAINRAVEIGAEESIMSIPLVEAKRKMQETVAKPIHAKILVAENAFVISLTDVHEAVDEALDKAVEIGAGAGGAKYHAQLLRCANVLGIPEADTEYDVMTFHELCEIYQEEWEEAQQLRERVEELEKERDEAWRAAELYQKEAYRLGGVIGGLSRGKIPCFHEAADAFWQSWKRSPDGYYESTWNAINAALEIARKLAATGEG